MNGAPAQGFALSVDLGTSNTVAILRWPDGRTRPLLVDGAPIMPSGVYVDEHGQLHVGRDAQRLAQLDPARFEPNPKRRIDEQAVLLGDREVPTVDLLAALLAAVARAAVEAVGFLPPAVLTYPAAWGAPRRDTLAAAAVRAGWSPPMLVPEPVAAARYFADVLRRPVPVGAALAVFDFGGGTLDIAVVRNDNGRFTVIGTGGVPDLGGLDVDAALVSHLGGVIGPATPDTWTALANPQSTTQRRDRRLFWDDVRGAKEMLSRAAVAPVAVPGRDQAVHLTREELERVAQPLLRRAVYETGAVIARCGLRADQLAGLFLVGGSSRLPLVARLLHSELGIAPTVLEQPELPVAEGALAEFVPTLAPPTPTAPPVSAPPVSPPAPAAPFVPAPVRGRRRMPWVVAAAAVLVLAVVAGVAWVLLRDTVQPVDFTTLSAGHQQPIEGVETIRFARTATLGDRSYAAWSNDDGEVWIAAIDLGRDRQLWAPRKLSDRSERWSGLYALPNAVVLYAEAVSPEPAKMVVIDPASGNRRWGRDLETEDDLYFFDANLVLYSGKNKLMQGLSWDKGTQRWKRSNPTAAYYESGEDTIVRVVGTPDQARGPANFSGSVFAPGTGDARLVQIGASSKRGWLIDAAKGDPIREWQNIGGSSDQYRAFDDKLVVVSFEVPYRVNVFDLTTNSQPQTIYTAKTDKRRVEPRGIAPCGEGRLCLLDNEGYDDQTAQVVNIDIAGEKEVWRKDAKGADTLVSLGDGVLATNTTSSTIASAMFDKAGKQLLGDDDRKSAAVRVNADSALLFSRQASVYAEDVSLVGRPIDGDRVSIGQLSDVRSASCSWNESAIVCVHEKAVRVWKFAA